MLVESCVAAIRLEGSLRRNYPSAWHVCIVNYALIEILTALDAPLRRQKYDLSGSKLEVIVR